MNPISKANSFAEKLRRIKEVIFPPISIKPISNKVLIMRDVRVPMRDGAELSVNIYRPKSNNPVPALINLHPYNKDNLPRGRHLPFQYRVIRQTNPIQISNETSWEAPDPDFWVQQDFIIVCADKRGFGKSGGTQAMMNDEEARDYYDLIEWVAHQPWCSGKVGLLGVSYLAISQYKVAALNPPHLSAICPWEGLSDAYKDAFRPGGIREDGFVLVWSKGLKKQPGPSFRQMQLEHTLRDDFYKSMVPDLAKIKVPALICGSFSDHQLHTRGSFRAFEMISSDHKWLYTHRSGKWAVFYSNEAKQLQLKFFNYFLKSIPNGMQEFPRVRVEVREFRDAVSNIIESNQWPLANTRWQTLYLSNADRSLKLDDLENDNRKTISLLGECAYYDYLFAKDTQIIGPMKLSLFLVLTDGDDANIFVGIQKFHKGQEVSFEGSYGFANDVVTKGFMKVSCRKVDTTSGSPYYPEHQFDSTLPIKKNEIICLEISLLPSATLFREKDVMRLIIQGKPLLKYGKLNQIGNYEQSANNVAHILSGKSHQSCLLIPEVI